MKITIIAVGKKHDTNFSGAIAEYQKRLSAHCDFAWQLVPSADKTKESVAILRLIADLDVVVLLDERGKLWDNKQLAYYLEEAQNRSVKKLVFIIGGAYGVDNTIINRANAIMALSPLVFPHQIVRLLAVEQLYRTFSIISGGKYHHK